MLQKELCLSGKMFRPRPECFLSSDKKLLAVITSWGEEQVSLKDVFEHLDSHYNALDKDSEQTRFTPFIEGLTLVENNMRSAVLKLNETIYNEVNKEEYMQGFELLFVVIQNQVCTLIQIGCPLILIDGASGGDLRPVGSSVNHLWSFFPDEFKMAPLPSQLLGMYDNISFHPVSFRFLQNDRFILLNRHSIPHAWFRTQPDERTIEQLHKLCAEDGLLVDKVTGKGSEMSKKSDKVSSNGGSSSVLAGGDGGTQQAVIEDEHSVPFWLKCVSLSTDGFS